MNTRLAVLVVVLVLLAGIGALLYLRLSRGRNLTNPPAVTTAALARNDAKNPVQKWVFDDGRTIVWEVKGIVVKPFEAKQGLLQGTFRVEGDTNQTEIPAQVGYLNGTVTTGQFEGKLGGSTVGWKIVDQVSIQQNLAAGRPLLLRIRWENWQQNNEALRKLETVWDGARNSFNNGTVSVPKSAPYEFTYSYEVGISQ